MIEENSVELSFFSLGGKQKIDTLSVPAVPISYSNDSQVYYRKMKLVGFFVQYPPVSLLVYVQGPDRPA